MGRGVDEKLVLSMDPWLWRSKGERNIGDPMALFLPHSFPKNNNNNNSDDNNIGFRYTLNIIFTLVL